MRRRRSFQLRGTGTRQRTLVNAHMLLQVARGDRRITTSLDGTFEWSFARVRSQMYFQITVIR